MPNVTVNVDAETYRNARIWAAKNNTTISSAVRDVLRFMPRFSAQNIESLRGENRRRQPTQSPL